MNNIVAYVDRIMAESTPDKPLWNIEKIAEGGINRYTPAAANRHTRIELCLR